MNRIKLLSLLMLCILGIAAAFSQGQQQNQMGKSDNQSSDDFKIGVEVNMISVPVTVRKKEGGFIKGLPQKAFHIYENGEPQEVLIFSQEAVPTRIAMVLDISGSVRTEWGTIVNSTKKFLSGLKKEDKFSIVTFNTDIRLKMDWGQKTDRVDDALSIVCKDNTKVWDAIYVVSNDVFKGIKEKKAMIIMSDGLDNNSDISFDEALDSAVRSGAAIYVVSKTAAVQHLYTAQSIKDTGRDETPYQFFQQADSMLKKLAYETGGRVLYPDTFGELGNVYTEVEEELRNQYILGYVSSNPIKDGSYRNIKLRVDAPGAVISARPGYYSPNEMPRR
jgi:Ca-activated chloride channel homolog